jgi:hypothetical protein
VKERIKTQARIVDTGCEAEERILTLSRVAAGIASVRRRADPESVRGRRKPKAGERERDQNETATPRRTPNRISCGWDYRLVLNCLLHGMTFLSPRADYVSVIAGN